MALVIELQTASGVPNGAYNSPSRLTTKAWAKLDLFEIHGRVVSGRWRLPMRITPIKPHLTTNDVGKIQQVFAHHKSVYESKYLFRIMNVFCRF
jgi:hypothetical protein